MRVAMGTTVLDYGLRLRLVENCRAIGQYVDYHRVRFNMVEQLALHIGWN
jgi:hypothetical protein